MKELLRLEGVCKRFGGIVTANDVQFTVHSGEIHGLIGPNGAGKTTIMNLISGIYSVDAGKIFLEGRDITKEPAARRARLGVGRTFQTPRFMHRSNIYDNLMVGSDIHSGIGYFKSFLGFKTDFSKELELLMSFAGFDVDWDEDISAIPFGQRKLLEIVRSLLGRPKILLVDEPAAGLTTQEIVYVKNLLNYAAKECGIGVLLIEHQMELVMEICEWIDVLDFGKIIASGKPKQIAENPDVIEAYLGGLWND